jgi:hypothetical protein
MGHTDEISEMIRDGHEVQARMRDRVQEVREGKLYHSGIDDEELSRHSENAREVWELMKEERNALLAVLLEGAWQVFKREADDSPTRLTEYWSGQKKIVTPEMIRSRGDTLDAITNSQRNMVSGVMDLWAKFRDAEHAAEADDPQARAYRRMAKMNEFAANHEIHCSDTAFYLSNGFSGALQVGHGVSRVIPQVFKRTNQRPIDPDEYAQILQRSYRRFFVRPAYLDKSVGIPLMNAPFQNAQQRSSNLEMDPLSLKLEGTDLMPVVESVPSSIADRSRQTQIGCIALFAKDLQTDQNVNRAFFEHYTGVVEKQHIRA